MHFVKSFRFDFNGKGAAELKVKFKAGSTQKIEFWFPPVRNGIEKKHAATVENTGDLQCLFAARPKLPISMGQTTDDQNWLSVTDFCGFHVTQSCKAGRKGLKVSLSSQCCLG